MEIKTAAAADLGTVHDIVQTTINAVYPHYYPKGAVDFFLAHHSREHIASDIAGGLVSIAYSGGRAVGTVTVWSGSSFCRRSRGMASAASYCALRRQRSRGATVRRGSIRRSRRSRYT